MEDGTCKCNDDDDARCQELKVTFEGATDRCNAFHSDSVTCEAEENRGFCLWKGVMQDNHVVGACVTSACWLKAQHTLAACPELWPNMTTLSPAAFASPSKQSCSLNCAPSFVSFYNDDVCMEWLDDMVLCDRWRLRAPFQQGCAPKPWMRADMESLATSCVAVAEREEFIVLLMSVGGFGIFVCVCANFISHMTHKAEALVRNTIRIHLSCSKSL